MKKLIYFLILLFPIIVFAYSPYIAIGGETLGIEVNTKGIVIVGLYKVNGEYINPQLQVGDTIIKVNNNTINTKEELISNIKDNLNNSEVPITYIRNNKEINDKLNLIYTKDNYRTGLYIKESVLGIGTLSYIDPTTKVYGVLGHALNITNTNDLLKIKNGTTYNATVKSFTRSIDGSPGSKNADINKDKVFGNIKTNTNYGIYGKTKINTDDLKLYEVGNLFDAKLGSASIITTNINNEKETYDIKIIEINKESDEKNIYFEITDKELLKMSGGIVQGMSGSPIIQDNKIIGAVTRVLVDEVTRGYGISIITMLEEGDKLLN